MNQPAPPPQRRPDGAYPGGAYSGGYSGGYQAPTGNPGYVSPASGTQRPAKDSEQLLAEALRAMASGAASIGSAGSGSVSPGSHAPMASQRQAPGKGWTELALLCSIVGLTVGIIVGLASFYW